MWHLTIYYRITRMKTKAQFSYHDVVEIYDWSRRPESGIIYHKTRSQTENKTVESFYNNW